MLLGGCAYNPKYDGKTAVFLELNHAKIFRTHQLLLLPTHIHTNIVILKIKLSGELYTGEYGIVDDREYITADVYIGDTIVELTEI